LNRRKRIFQIIEKAEGNDIPSRVFDYFILFLNVSNVLAVVLQSFENLSISYSVGFRIFETVSVLIFSIEILFRLITSDFKYPKKKMVYSILRYSISFMAVIDLLAIIPFYLPLLLPIDLRFLRILRLTRILRILKVNRYSKSLDLIGQVLNRKKYELFVTMFITSILLLLASSIMYYLENGAQPESFPNIIASFWWAIATLTTVGYGDVYPITILGKIISGIIALLGIGLVALPTGIISSGFLELIEDKKDNEGINYCPKCGERLR